MGCLDLRVTLLNTALAVAGTIVPVTAEAAANVTPPTASAAISQLTPPSARAVATVLNAKPTLVCSLVEVGGRLGMAVEIEPPPVVSVNLEPVPVVAGTILNDLELSVENATAEVTTEVGSSFVCFVNEDDITVLATADGEPLRTANGGYLRLPDDEDEEIIDEP